MPARKLKRLWLISHSVAYKKMQPIRNRFCAKSRICRRNASKIDIVGTNFRGSLFKDIKFSEVKIEGCDFWGAKFKNCKFLNVKISYSSFVGCVFENCTFINAIFYSSYIVTTKTDSFKDAIDASCYVTADYPQLPDKDFLFDSLAELMGNSKLRLTKLIHISDKKLNELNMFLLLRHYEVTELVKLLLLLNNQPLRNIVTFDSLKYALKRTQKESMLKTSRPTQS